MDIDTIVCFLFTTQIPEDAETKQKVDIVSLESQRDSLQTEIYTLEIDILNCKRKTLTCKIEIRKRELAGMCFVSLTIFTDRVIFELIKIIK